MTTSTSSSSGKSKLRFDSESLTAIQNQLQKAGADGWLFYYFKNNDPLALRILKLTETHMFSRRWFYFVPAKGEPTKLVHQIESDALKDLPGERIIYVGWKEMEEKLATILKGRKSVAMQYSPRNAIPYISRVDAGTIELVRDSGVDVISSHNLVQTFEATWSEEQLQSHIYATDKLRSIVDDAFSEVKRRLESNIPTNEYDIQRFIVDKFDQYKMTTYSPPIVAINENSGNPHYQPTESVHKEIKEGDFLLIDLWAKQSDVPGSVYGDITWTGYVGKNPPEKFIKIFEIVRDARNAALEYVRKAVEEKREIFGWQVDDVARQYIKEKGYGEYFVHRTGHSIGEEVHGNGANIDNLETRDERAILPNTGFSIEPGVYLEEFGVRSEIDVYVDENGVTVAGQPIQEKLIEILA